MCQFQGVLPPGPAQPGTIERARTWCFLAEIVTVTAPFSAAPVLHHLLVRDRTGKELPVYFYPECGSFDYTELRVGRTVAILFAERHDFLDLSMGVRIENLDTLRVVNNCRPVRDIPMLR